MLPLEVAQHRKDLIHNQGRVNEKFAMLDRSSIQFSDIHLSAIFKLQHKRGSPALPSVKHCCGFGQLQADFYLQLP